MALKERETLNSSTSESDEEVGFNMENYLKLKRQLEKYEQTMELKKQRTNEQSTSNRNLLENQISSLIDSDEDTILMTEVNNSFTEGT